MRRQLETNMRPGSKWLLQPEPTSAEQAFHWKIGNSISREHIALVLSYRSPLTPAIKIQPCQIRKLKDQIKEMKKKSFHNLRENTTHSGPAVKHINLKSEIDYWTLQERQTEIFVTTHNISTEASYLQSNLKDGNTKKLTHRTYSSLSWYNLSITIPTHTHRAKIEWPFIRNVTKRFWYFRKRIQTKWWKWNITMKHVCKHGWNSNIFWGQAETTVHLTGCNSVAIRGSGSSNHRMTVCITVVSDGTKLPLFVISQGQPMELIEKIFLRMYQTVSIIAANHKGGWINVEWKYG